MMRTNQRCPHKSFHVRLFAVPLLNTVCKFRSSYSITVTFVSSNNLPDLFIMINAHNKSVSHLDPNFSESVLVFANCSSVQNCQCLFGDDKILKVCIVFIILWGRSHRVKFSCSIGFETKHCIVMSLLILSVEFSI